MRPRKRTNDPAKAKENHYDQVWDKISQRPQYTSEDVIFSVEWIINHIIMKYCCEKQAYDRNDQQRPNIIFDLYKHFIWISNCLKFAKISR
jgi:hypothetical protein